MTDLRSTRQSLWLRLQGHFSESFSGGPVYSRRAFDEQRVNDLERRRQRNAYRYILLLLAVILLPINANSYYLGQMVPMVAGLFLLGILMVNILLLSMDRDAFLMPPLVLLLSISLVMLSIYYGENYGLYLLFPLLVALPVLLKTRFAMLIGVLSGLLVAPLLFTSYDTSTALIVGMSMGLTWLVSAWLVFAVTEQARHLRGMAITDPLTGAYNRRYLQLQAELAMAEWLARQLPACLLLIDIDYFKRVNDKFGHSTGDTAIVGVVDVISGRIRDTDTLCRFGGEEFVALLHGTPLDGAMKVAEDIRQLVQQAPILKNGAITVSVGVADVSVATDMDNWLVLADTALYLAKNNGRNRVEKAGAADIDLQPASRNVPDWR